MTRYTVRLHILADEAGAAEANSALRGLAELVPQESPRGLWAASGQWTPEDATTVLETCAGLPVKVVRGVLLGVEEKGVTIVDKASEKPADSREDVRLTVRAAKAEWALENEEYEDAASKRA